LAQIEASKHSYLKPHVLFYKRNILEQDPTDVERVMLRIRRLGAFKPWGSSVSAIEMALWDIAGKAAGVPVYKLLGGKIRDKVRVYNGGDMPYAPSGLRLEGTSPEDYFNYASKRKKLPGGFKIMKFGIGFHSGMPWTFPRYHYGEKPLEPRAPYLYQTGLTTEPGLKYTIDCVGALKEALGDEVGLALDCGPGWKVPAAIRLAKALEPLNVMWLEDMITGDYTPYTLPNVYGVLIAPHGVGDGPIGLAALVQVSAALPQNYIAFELPIVGAEWYGLVEGLPKNVVKDGFIEVPDKPGMGVELNEKAVRKHLKEGETYFDDE